MHRANFCWNTELVRLFHLGDQLNQSLTLGSIYFMNLDDNTSVLASPTMRYLAWVFLTWHCIPPDLQVGFHSDARGSKNYGLVWESVRMSVRRVCPKQNSIQLSREKNLKNTKLTSPIVPSHHPKTLQHDTKNILYPTKQWLCHDTLVAWKLEPKAGTGDSPN